MKKIKKKIVICAVFALASAGCGSKLPVEQEYIEGQTETAESGTETIAAEKEVSTEWEEEAQAAEVYQYWEDFKNERDLPYADDTTVRVLMDAYEELEYVGTFEPGNVEDYDEYIKKYKRLVDNEVSFLDDEGKEFYVSEYEMLGEDSYTDFLYYFFDVDGDGEPELGIQGYSGIHHFMDVFDYDWEEDSYHLWYSGRGNGYELAGTRKIMWTDFMHIGLRYAFTQLDAEGNAEADLFFFFTPFNETETLYVVMVPEYADESREIELTDEMKKRGIYTTSYGGMWYFRVPQTEFEELEKMYEAARMEAEKQREEVTYTYEELFGADW